MKTLEQEKIIKAFGRYIREARENKELTQAEAARQVGCCRSYYCMIESGDREVHLTMALKICEVVDLDIGDFAKRMR